MAVSQHACCRAVLGWSLRRSTMSLVQDELRPEIHLSRLGDMEVTCVLDGRAVRPGLTPSHGGELLANDVRKLAEANGIDPNLYEHSFTPMLVKTGSELV